MLTADQTNVLKRIVNRLKSTDEATFRAGGRSVALQAVEHRLAFVQSLRAAIGELGESERTEYQRGYHDALSDLLVATEAALEPRETEVRARHELQSNPVLQQVLDQIGPTPTTPGDVAKLIGKSAASAGRYFAQLRALELIAAVPSTDSREHPHRVTPLGARLAQPSKQTKPDEPQKKNRVRTATPIPILSLYQEFANSLELGVDSVTGMKFWNDDVHRAIATQVDLHRQAGLPLTIMRVDIRHFHEINASADFAGVNKLVMHVAQTLRRELAVTGSAELARYDWDKFVIMLLNQPVVDARKLAANLLSKLEPIDAHIGIAWNDPKHASDADALLEASALALQEAKEEGIPLATRLPEPAFV